MRKNKEDENRYQRTWRSRNKDKVKRWARTGHLRRLYGMSDEDYQSMLAGQRNSCAICLVPATEKLHVDHDHETTQVRGLLCGKCNTGLGLFSDSPELLQAAASYLEWHGKDQSV